MTKRRAIIRRIRWRGGCSDRILTPTNPICNAADAAVSLGREAAFLVGNCLLDKSCRAGRPTGLPTLDGIGRKDSPMEGGDPLSLVVLHGVLLGDTGARQRESKSLDKNFFLKITENQRPSELVQDLPPLSR